MEQYKYKVYAIDSNYREYYRIIYRKRKLNPVQIYELGGRFADKLASKYTRNFILFGCIEV